MLAILLLASLGAAPAEGRVVERIVAVVRNPAGAQPRPVMLTRLAQEARVALVAQGALEAAAAPLDEAALRAALRWLLDQLLVADEAARLQVDEVPREEVLAATRRFRERFPGEAAYRRFLQAAELSEEDLQVILARDLRVQRYLDSRVGRASRVGDEELARFLASQGATLEAAGAVEAVRARLASDKAQAQVRQLLSDLRARADVRVLAPGLASEGAP
ncbi:MAG: hypothetical protein NDI82_08680 [Anaeromyxobacteraceae bacterium]|nr:hypothetical protein [Anaeromyxobacteraceae bacterium]